MGKARLRIKLKDKTTGTYYECGTVWENEREGGSSFLSLSPPKEGTAYPREGEVLKKIVDYYESVADMSGKYPKVSLVYAAAKAAQGEGYLNCFDDSGRPTEKGRSGFKGKKPKVVEDFDVEDAPF